MGKGSADLTGQKHGELTVVRRSIERSARSAKNAIWDCACSCGVSLAVTTKQLIGRQGGCPECRRWPAKHGHSRSNDGKHSPTYASWAAMLNRCANPNTPMFAKYGAKGVRVCKRWRDFQNFLVDMGERPSGKTLDRFPKRNGNYEPGNCRWATRLEQAINREMTVLDEAKVIRIREMRSNGMMPTEIARQLELSVHVVADVVRRKTWLHVDP